VELFEAMTTQRAIRRIKPDPVDDATIRRLLELAIKAPTGSNKQGWEWIVVRDPKVKRELARKYRAAYRLYGRAGRWAKRKEPKTLRLLDAVDWQVKHFEEIPVFVIPCLHGSSFPYPWIYRSSRYGSIYPAIQNLLLAARAEGIGAALTTLPLWNQLGVRRLLGLPMSVEPIAIIPLGHPIGRYGPTTRTPIEDIAHLDRYGNKLFGGERITAM
jgi:nitroreductase